MRVDRQQPDLPSWLWLWTPVGVLALIAAGHLLRGQVAVPLYGESGFIEILTALVLAAAIYTGISLLLARAITSTWARRWVVLLTVGCVYFLGEELSWGQHIFGWTSPDWLMALNYQGETNLHNIDGLFDSQPRNLLTLLVLVGLIAASVPKSSLGNRRSAFVAAVRPTAVFIPTAVIVLLLSTRRVLGLGSEVPGFGVVHLGEVKELYLAFALWMYLGSLLVRNRSEPHRPT